MDDLKRAPVTTQLAPATDLPRPVIDACRAVAAHLRERHAGFYQRTADETEALLADEVEAARAEDLGKIDTFRFEEDKVLEAALEALGRGDCDRAARVGRAAVEPRPASRRSGSATIPLGSPPGSSFGDAARSARPSRARANGCGSAQRDGASMPPSSATSSAAPPSIRRTAISSSGARRCSTRRCRSSSRCGRASTRCAAPGATGPTRWARDFNALCKAHGFLAGASLQQRTIFDEVVRPLAQESGTTAFFVVDAFRFEMGEELYATLADTPATTVACSRPGSRSCRP